MIRRTQCVLRGLELESTSSISYRSIGGISRQPKRVQLTDWARWPTTQPGDWGKSVAPWGVDPSLSARWTSWALAQTATRYLLWHQSHPARLAEVAVDKMVNWDIRVLRPRVEKRGLQRQKLSVGTWAFNISHVQHVQSCATMIVWNHAEQLVA